MIVDWPQNIGGKPNWTFYHNMPAFVPILFECTVMFAAHLMSITYLIRCGLFPGGKSESPDPRTTDDKFLMVINVDGDTSSVKEMLTKTGASEIKDMGKVMGEIKKKHAESIDFSKVIVIVKDLLNK